MLLARVRTLLSRGTRSTSGPKLIANVHIDANAQVVTADGILIELTKTEYDVLTTLAAREGHIVSKAELMREVVVRVACLWAWNWSLRISWPNLCTL